MKRPPKKRVRTKRPGYQHDYRHYWSKGTRGALVESPGYAGLAGKTDDDGRSLRSRVRQADEQGRAFRYEKPETKLEWTSARCPQCQGRRVAWVDSYALAKRLQMDSPVPVRSQTVLIRECQDCGHWKSWMDSDVPVKIR